MGAEGEAVINGFGESVSVDADGLAAARRRGKHFIVVMFENRSFDQLFGLLDHPERDRYAEWFVHVGDHPNLYTRSKPHEPFAVTGDGNPVLGLDPPHGHRSALDQLRKISGTFRMDGFVDAYARKYAGEEPVPTLRYGRVGIAALVALAATGLAVADARRLVADGRGLVWHAVAVGGTAVGLAAGLWPFPGLSRWRIVAGSAGAAVIGVFATAGVVEFESTVRFWPWILGGAVLGAAGGLVAIRTFNKRRRKASEPPDDAAVRDAAARIMACMPPHLLPELAALARNYATCVQWHSSVPGATWPNRNFVHAATSDESVDIEVGFYSDPTIFDLLDRERPQLDDDDRRRTPWRIYFHDMPQVIAFRRLWRGKLRGRWYSAERLLDAIDRSDLPTYAFVEPCHTGGTTSSQHPGNNEKAESDDFRRGEDLLAAIHGHLAANPDLFKETVLVITYDEHGGLFDHRPPPAAAPPDAPAARFRARTIARRLVRFFVDYHTDPFAFDRLGVRVPTVIVSPWVKPGKIDTTLYDHASVVATLRRLWAPHHPPLSARDRAAHDFLHLLVESDTATVRPGPVPAAPVEAAEIGWPLVETRRPDLEPVAVRAEEQPELEMQLARMDRLVRRRLPRALANPQRASIVSFRESADSTRNGNPSIDDF